jgi:hypothetical protein
MKRVHHVALVVFAVCAALAFAACGNSEENGYIDQLNAQTDELGTAITDAGAGVNPGDPQGAVAAIDTAQQAISDNADALEQITPPDQVADLHAQLVETTRTVADQLAEFQKALTSGNPQELAQAAQKLQTSMTAALAEQSSIIDQINAEFGN